MSRSKPCILDLWIFGSSPSKETPSKEALCRKGLHPWGRKRAVVRSSRSLVRQLPRLASVCTRMWFVRAEARTNLGNANGGVFGSLHAARNGMLHQAGHPPRLNSRSAPCSRSESRPRSTVWKVLIMVSQWAFRLARLHPNRSPASVRDSRQGLCRSGFRLGFGLTLLLLLLVFQLGVSQRWWSGQLVSSQVFAQDSLSAPTDWRAAAIAGEYTLAASAAEQLASGVREETLSQIERHRLMSQYSVGGLPSPTGVSLGGLGDGRGGNGELGAGGMMQADFSSIINLIQSTVEPLSWEDNGGTGAMMAFPNGVLIDVRGQLKIESMDARRGSQLWRERSAPEDGLPEPALRFVSLPKLESELTRLIRQGERIPESLRYMGGLYDIHSIVLDPIGGDLWLVGPAGPWESGPQGIVVNKQSGRPVLHLDDMVVCWRNVVHGRGVLGCSIDPRPGQFERAAELAGRWNLTLPRVRAEFLTAVGPQDTVVFGVPKRSHAAQVLLLADYHVKLLAMGNVKAGPQLSSYLDRCRPDDPPAEILRWWFTVGEPRIERDQAGTTHAFDGPYMELKTESRWLQQNGRDAPPPSVPAESFVNDFNRQMPALRKVFPVYGQLENLYLWSLVCRLIETQKLNQSIGWKAEFLIGDRRGGGYQTTEYPEIKEVELVVNHRTMQSRAPQVRGRGGLQRHTIIAVSGGVEVSYPTAVIASLIKTDPNGSTAMELQPGIEDGRTRLGVPAIGSPRVHSTALSASPWFIEMGQRSP